MAIRSVVTRGYGNGTFAGSIAEVVTRGYTIGASVSTLRDIVVRGYGNGTFQPALYKIVTRGYWVNPVDDGEAADAGLSLISDTKAAATINALLQVVARYRETGQHAIAEAWMNAMSAIEREDQTSLYVLRIKYGLKIDDLEARVIALQARADALENP